jgi:nucleoside-diphosphate-sugar epimerase
MRSIVVGGAGFLGGAVVRQLVARGDDVVVVDRERPAPPWAPEVDVEMRRADIADRAALARAFRGAGEVYHLAGRLGTSELERELRAAVEVNVVGTLNVFDAALDAGVGTVVLACKPNVWLNAYTVTKEAAEKLALLYGLHHDLRVHCLRYYNAYGPRQHLAPVRKLVPTFAACALRGRPLPVFGDGSQTVDLLHVDDLARITVDVARAGVAVHEAIDCGSGMARSVDDVAALVNELLGNDAGIERLPMRVGEPAGTTLVADTGALEQLVGPLSLRPLDDGLASTLDWYAGLHPAELDGALALLRAA